ncbi:DUF4349 domain-containing protein, partial [Micromonospora sp. NPDC000207]|uniref:DUF4349 domain-containing protein n=1 Tax=Micromonospora sp. NPDC000207 TaxID=3154246 RepID=UPI00331DDC41
SESTADRAGPVADAPRAVAPAPAERGPGAQGQATGADLRIDQRSIVYTGTMRVQVQDVEEAARATVTAATTAGGFVGGDERRSRGSDARAELTLRIPAERFTAVLDQLAQLGRQESRNIVTEDVTEEVVDLDARITTQRARVESARRLLAQAEDIGDLVTVERELASREADLASLEAKKRRLADLTALSTISVTLVGPDAASADEERTGFLTGLRAGWEAFGLSVAVLLTVLGAVLPWLLLIGVPVGALVVVLRRRRRRNPPPPPPGRPVGPAWTPVVDPTGAPPSAGAHPATGPTGPASEPPPVPAARSAP